MVPRKRLIESLDEIFSEPLGPSFHRDAVESKLFGIGSEAFVAGSHEFYLGYAITREKVLCLDMGHFHPTESVADKISSTLLWVPELLLHVSRGIRWDSDHVVLFDDSTRALCEELVRCKALDRVYLGFDFFDASINRIAAWVLGTRNYQKCLLHALLAPEKKLAKAESESDFTGRLVWMEESKTLPFGEVWNEFCRRQNVPEGGDWFRRVRQYESEVLNRR